MLDRKIENRQLLNIIALFSIVQFAGLLITIYTFGPDQVFAAPVSSPSSSVTSALFYLVYIIVAAAAIILLIRYVKGDILFILLEGFVVFFATSFLLFLLLLSTFPTVNFVYIAIISAVTTIAFIIAKNYRPRLRNFIAITSSIGVGIVIGLNGFNLCYLLMMFIAIYDYVAVFVTKHMITLAKAVSSRNLAFLIGSSDIEAIPQKYVTKRDLADFKKNVNMKDIKDPVLKDIVAKGGIPVISQVQLGTGDLALPLMLTVSTYISFLSYIIPIMVIVGSIAGMIFTMYLLKTYKVALPAIPPIFAFINLFLGLTLLVVKTRLYSLWGSFLVIFVVTIAILMLKLREIREAEKSTKAL